MQTKKRLNKNVKKRKKKNTQDLQLSFNIPSKKEMINSINIRIKLFLINFKNIWEKLN
jgi:hypothetical protein